LLWQRRSGCHTGAAEAVDQMFPKLMKRFVLVSGCPRSGTTMLTTALNWASSCFVGQERFNLLFNRTPIEFTPELFQPSRIKDFQTGDCGYNSFTDLKEYFSIYSNSEAIDGIEEAVTVGDKLISLYRNFDVLDRPDWKNSDTTILHIVRNVADVANSYQGRFDDEKDQWSENFSSGISEWSTSVEKTFDRLKASNLPPIKIVSYENIIESSHEEFLAKCDVLYSNAGLVGSAKTKDGLSRLYANIKQRTRRPERSPGLTPNVLATVKPSTLEKYEILKKQSIV
jgi:hypothetical protein